jgi:uncharacterized protein
MPTSNEDPQIVQVPAEHRFVARMDGKEAELVYGTEPGTLLVYHTEVPEEMEGHGLGGRLVRAAVDSARVNRLTLVPWCPFARRWLHEHADAAQGVTVDWGRRPPAQ